MEMCVCVYVSVTSIQRSTLVLRGCVGLSLHGMCCTLKGRVMQSPSDVPAVKTIEPKIMWVKQCHNHPFGNGFYNLFICGDLGDGLFLF